MTPEYLPTTLEGKLGRLAEECGEVVQMVGKIMRFGWDSHSPKDPLQTPNWLLLLDEMYDCKHAIDEMIAEIGAQTKGTEA